MPCFANKTFWKCVAEESRRNKMPNEYELIPKYDTRKSFYGKARVQEDDDGRKYLISYGVRVCYIGVDGNMHRLWSGWSNTTGRHVKEFWLQNGGQGKCNKAAWDSLEVENLETLR